MSNRKCADCGSQLGADEGCWAEGRKKDVCSDCYYDIVKKCQLCGNEDLMPSDVSEFIVCKTELGATCRRPPGIYMVTDYPFLSIPMIGSGSMDGGSVVFVDRLPVPDVHYEISGHVCVKCAKPYKKAFRRAYKGRSAAWMRSHRMGTWNQRANKLTPPCSWAMENAHTRSVILANTDMLRDLECDTIDRGADGNHLPHANASRWNDLKEIYNLPDGIPTYHDWVLLKYKGVTIYRTSQDDSYGEHWLTWHPEPRYRTGGHGEDQFSAGSLPTFPDTPESDDGKYHSHYDWTRQHAIPAIKRAIAEGILTQVGVFVNGKELVCR